MKNVASTSPVIDWLFGPVVFTIGVLNCLLVHPVPGMIALFLSLVYLPPANALFHKWTGVTIPPAVKIILGVLIIWFTLGVSDLGDMID